MVVDPVAAAARPGAGGQDRAEQFDQAVLEAVAELEERWPTEVASIEFAVDEVPPLPSSAVVPANDVVVDGACRCPDSCPRRSTAGAALRRRASSSIVARSRSGRGSVDLSELVVEVSANN